jgi:hypothetical protein
VRQHLAVVERELRERWLLVPGALALGFVPFLLPLLGVDREGAVTTGLLIACLYGGMVALIAGGTVLGRDLANRRLAFHFSRPLPWGTVWGGKWTAAVILTFGTGVLAAIPWLAFMPTFPGLHPSSLLDTMGSFYALGLALLLIGAGNAAVVAGRARSAWLTVDLVLIAVAVFATRAVVGPLVSTGLLRPEGWGFAWLPWPLAIALTVGAAAQVCHGRTDLRRSHLALSLTFWAVVLSCIGSAAAYSRWAMAVGPRDVLGPLSLEPAPRGGWTLLSGSTNRGGWFRPSLLLNAEDGAFARCGSLNGVKAAYSRNGHRLALLGLKLPGDFEGNFNTGVSVVDLEARSPRPRPVALSPDLAWDWMQVAALSESHDSLLVAQKGLFVSYDLASGRRTASVALPGDLVPVAVRQLTKDRVRVWLRDSPWAPQRRERSFEVTDVRLFESRTEPVGHFESHASFVRMSPTADRLLVIGRDVKLHDAGTGQVLAMLVALAVPGVVTPLFWQRGADAAFLGDGSIAVVTHAGSEARLLLFDAQGAPGPVIPLASTVALSPVSIVRVGGEVSPGLLAVGLLSHQGGPRETVIVDLLARRIARHVPDCLPAEGDPRSSFMALATMPSSPGSSGTRLLFGKDDALVLFDPATGGQRILTGAAVHE